MEIAVNSFSFSLNPKIITYKKTLDVILPKLGCKPLSIYPQMGNNLLSVSRWGSKKYRSAVSAVELSGLENVEVSSSSPSEDFAVSTSGGNEAGELKIKVEVFGPKTREIFDQVFDKMVAAAQPIPGFKRVKGGKGISGIATSAIVICSFCLTCASAYFAKIPRDVLLEILGPSIVYSKVIKKVINTVIAEYVAKENLKVTTDLRIEQSYEDLEDLFAPGDNFSFDAVLLQVDPFLTELTALFEKTTDKGSVWVTTKRSSLKPKVQINKLKSAGEPIEYRCLIRATDGKKTISTSVGAKDHQKFQASYATILKAHMTALKKRERKDKKKAAGGDSNNEIKAKKPKKA
ncbi:hypothetical protein ACFE04_005248 [Oxalis oulophora]